MTSPNPPSAPHGYDADGNPLAPFGLKANGEPRISNRGGRRAGAGRQTATKAPSAPRTTQSNLTDFKRKAMLLDLSNQLIVAPLASLSQVPAIAKKIGPVQADALAGDAFILAQCMPQVADGLILLSQTKPGALAWLDRAEENAPYVVLAGAILMLGKAIADNHMNPNPRVAEAGRNYARMRMDAMAAEVNRQAEQSRAEYADAAETTRQFAESE